MLPCSAPWTFTTKCPKQLSETRGQKEEVAHGQRVNVQPNAPPEDLLGPTQAPSAFPVFVQHIHAHDGAHASNNLTCCPIEMYFKQAVLYLLKNC